MTAITLKNRIFLSVNYAAVFAPSDLFIYNVHVAEECIQIIKAKSCSDAPSVPSWGPVPAEWTTITKPAPLFLIQTSTAATIRVIFAPPHQPSWNFGLGSCFGAIHRLSWSDLWVIKLEHCQSPFLPDRVPSDIEEEARDQLRCCGSPDHRGASKPWCVHVLNLKLRQKNCSSYDLFKDEGVTYSVRTSAKPFSVTLREVDSASTRSRLGLNVKLVNGIFFSLFFFFYRMWRWVVR